MQTTQNGVPIDGDIEMVKADAVHETLDDAMDPRYNYAQRVL